MTENTDELDGTVAIVTGSARNIGRAIALQLAAAGAAVVVHARTSREPAEATAREIAKRGGRALVHLADVTSPEQASCSAEVPSPGRGIGKAGDPGVAALAARTTRP